MSGEETNSSLARMFYESGDVLPESVFNYRNLVDVVDSSGEPDNGQSWRRAISPPLTREKVNKIVHIAKITSIVDDSDIAKLFRFCGIPEFQFLFPMLVIEFSYLHELPSPLFIGF